MGELGLTKHADTRADKLSGGQLKRVNVALELLTKPSVLFLDEPTSGLDPGLDKSVMEQMRDLAHDGRTVIVVTHSVANLSVCDRLLVLVPGGKVAFFGPPEEGLQYFGEPGWAEVFQTFDREPDRDWAAQFQASRAHQEYVTRPQAVPAISAGPKAAGTPAPVRGGAFHQLGTLCRRYTRVLASDRAYVLSAVLMPFILGGLIFAVAGSQGLRGPNAEMTLIMLIVGVSLSATIGSIFELLRERNIYVRERAAGLSSGAYLGSKLVVLGVLVVIQALIVAVIGLAFRPLPTHGSLLTSAPFAELLIGVAVFAVASMSLGLAASALVKTINQATPFLVLIIFIQIMLSGGVFAVSGQRHQSGVVADPGPLGLRRGGVNRGPQPPAARRVADGQLALAALGHHLADRHRRDDRAVGRVRADRLVAAEPAQPRPAQVAAAQLSSAPGADPATVRPSRPSLRYLTKVP